MSSYRKVPVLSKTSGKDKLRNYPLVSLIIPARNEEKKIGQCIQTLKAQTYPNLEVFLVDDYSTDKTVEIAKSIIGNKVVVGHGVEIKNSIIFDECKISTNSFVGDCILGKGARVASGVITGNRRFDQKKVDIRIGKETYPTEMEKFGCVLGEYVRIGANCSTAPGTLIGKHSWTYANMMIRGIIPPKKLLKLRQELETVDKEETVLKREDSEGKI